MPRHLIRALTASTAPKAIQAAGPGSNGFWRRNVYSQPGTYTWTAQKSGKVKVQAIGTGCGAFNRTPGASGAYGEKTFDVIAGQTLTFNVGQGSKQVSAGNLAPDGGTTSISGGPLAGTPLVLVGAKSGGAAASTTPGAATGPWDVSFPGAKPIGDTGSPSSASPFGPGHVSRSGHGAGWFGDHGDGSLLPGSTHRMGIRPINNLLFTPGLLALVPGQSMPWWDLADADGASGSLAASTASTAVMEGGIGAGGVSSSSLRGFASILGGGTGNVSNSSSVEGGDSGFGAGGGAASTTDAPGGRGGNGYIQLFWDEVA